VRGFKGSLFSFFEIHLMQLIIRISGFLLLAVLLSTCSSSHNLFSNGTVRLLQQNASLSEVPIHVDKGLIFIEVYIGGAPYNFLFDSGAPMVISSALAKELELQSISNANIRDSQGSRKRLNYVRMPDFVLGDRSFSGLSAIAADLSASPILHCMKLDGIIGANAMQFQYWDFNMRDSILRVSSDKEHWSNRKKYVLPFKMKSSRTPLVQLNINDTEVKEVTFDTGSSGIFSLPKRMTTAFLPKNASFYSRGFLSAGLFGSAQDTAYEYEMRFVFPDTTYRFPVEQEHSKDGKLLGMGFLRHFHVYLDFQNQEILLEPLQVGPEPKAFSLAPFLRNDAIIVGLVNSLMPPEYQDIEVGDTISALNGCPVPLPASKEDFCQVLEAMKADCADLLIKDKGLVHICRKAIPGH
jgi:hypothetical protein